MKEVYKEIDKYYTDMISHYGATPKGVDWNGEESQFIRFKQISKVIDIEKFSIADIGCGYGKYCEHLSRHYKNYIYRGYDLSLKMISNAKNLYGDNPDVRFHKIDDLSEIENVDFSVASGIFSVKMHHKESEWMAYILDTLDVLNSKSKRGFSFNMLTKYSDTNLMRENLYYADPLFFFDYCKRNFSKEVALLHDYCLYEFTLIIRKGK